MGSVSTVSQPASPDGPEPPVDPRDLRCSDADREAVAETIRQAATDGRLTLEEMGDRLDVVYSARTYRDLEPAVRDLPGARIPGMPPGQPRPAQPTPGVPAVPAPNQVVVPSGTPVNENAVAIFTETKRLGTWLVPTEFASVALFGSVELDLREALLAGPEVTIQANAVFGEVKVVVGDGVTVSTVGTPVLGEYNGPHEQPVAGKPHVTLNGLALFGTVQVKRKTRRKRG